MSTAFQCEKYRRHLKTNPLFNLAYESPKSKLKRKSWQTISDNIFKMLRIDVPYLVLELGSKISKRLQNSRFSLCNLN